MTRTITTTQCEEEKTPITVTKCEVKNCLYNWLSGCILVKPPTINASGMCNECITLTLDEGFRDAEKSRQLFELEANSKTPLPDHY